MFVAALGDDELEPPYVGCYDATKSPFANVVRLSEFSISVPER
jgi:hypothetical protein